MENSTLFERASAREQIVDLIREVAANNSGHNLREKVLTVLLSGQVTRFLEDIDLITTLVIENNQLMKKLVSHMAMVDWLMVEQKEPDTQMALRFH